MENKGIKDGYDEIVLLDENGEKISYIFPETNWIRFRMTEGFKFAFNPGVYKDWRTKK